MTLQHLKRLLCIAGLSAWVVVCANAAPVSVAGLDALAQFHGFVEDYRAALDTDSTHSLHQVLPDLALLHDQIVQREYELLGRIGAPVAATGSPVLNAEAEVVLSNLIDDADVHRFIAIMYGTAWINTGEADWRTSATLALDEAVATDEAMAEELSAAVQAIANKTLAPHLSVELRTEASATEGTQLSVEVFIQNHGDLEAAAVWLKFVQPNQPEQWQSVGSIPGGSRAARKFFYSVPPVAGGFAVLRASVQAGNAMPTEAMSVLTVEAAP